MLAYRYEQLQMHIGSSDIYSVTTLYAFVIYMNSWASIPWDNEAIIPPSSAKYYIFEFGTQISKVFENFHLQLFPLAQLNFIYLNLGLKFRKFLKIFISAEL